MTDKKLFAVRPVSVGRGIIECCCGKCIFDIDLSRKLRIDKFRTCLLHQQLRRPIFDSSMKYSIEEFKLKAVGRCPDCLRLHRLSEKDMETATGVERASLQDILINDGKRESGDRCREIKETMTIEEAHLHMNRTLYHEDRWIEDGFALRCECQETCIYMDDVFDGKTLTQERPQSQILVNLYHIYPSAFAWRDDPEKPSTTGIERYPDYRLCVRLKFVKGWDPLPGVPRLGDFGGRCLKCNRLHMINSLFLQYRFLHWIQEAEKQKAEIARAG